MWAIGILCLLAMADVLAAPRYKREIAPRLHQRDISIQNRQAGDQQELTPNKSEDPQELFVNSHVEGGAEPDREEKDKEEPEKIDNHKFEEKENEKEENIKEKDEKDKDTEKDKEGEEKPEKPVEVVLEIAKPPSFINGLFSWPPSFSWPSFQLPTFSWPSFLGGRGRVVYPDYYAHYTNYPGYPNYRYVRIIQ